MGDKLRQFDSEAGMGGYVSIVISLLSAVVASASLLRSAWWPKEDGAAVLGYLAVAIMAVSLLMLVAVVLASMRSGPVWLRDLVDGLLSPSTKWSPDMTLNELLKRSEPKFVRGPNEGTVDDRAQQLAGLILRQIGTEASLEKLQVFGRLVDQNTQSKGVNVVPIGVEFWRDGGQISYSSATTEDGGVGRAERRYGGGRQESYVELGFDSRQVRRVFKLKRRLRLQRPWYWGN